MKPAILKPAILAVAAVVPLCASLAAAEDSLTRRGAYLARIMDCAGCHMPRDATGLPIASAGLSGGTVGFEIPGMGIFWPPNLTPDASGLGGWSKDQIATTLRTGVRPDGRTLAPAMPWPSYAGLSNADMSALVAYLVSLPPVAVERLEPVSEANEARAPFYRVVVPH